MLNLTEGSDAHVPDSVGPYRVKADALDTKNGLLAVGGEATLLVAVLEDPRLPQPLKRKVEFVIKEARDGIAGVSERVACQGWWQMQIADAENPHVEKVLTVMEGDNETPARYVTRRADYSLDTYLEQCMAHEDLDRRSFIAAGIALQMAEALAGVQRFAEKHGYREADVVHRDLKPANVLLRVTDDDIPFTTLIDFNGIAGREGSLKNSLSMGGLEGSKEMATLRYMSPEQEQIIYENRDKDDIDLRSDIYSLALVLVEMLGGSHGRRSVNIPEDTNPALKGIIRKCLAETPEGRYESPEDLVVALQQYVNTRQGRAFAGPGQLIVSTGDLESLRDADSTDMTPDKAAAKGLLARLKGKELLQLAGTLGLSTALGILAAVLGGLGSVTGNLLGKGVEAASKAYERRKIVKAMMDELEEKYPEGQIMGKIIAAVKEDRQMTPARKEEILSGALISKLERLANPEDLQAQIQEAVRVAVKGGELSHRDPLGIAQIVKSAVKEALADFSPLETQKKRKPVQLYWLVKQIESELRRGHENQVKLEAWINNKRTRENTRKLIPILRRVCSSRSSVEMAFMCVGIDSAFIPEGAGNVDELWTWIIEDYIEAGGVELSLLNGWLKDERELEEKCRRSFCNNVIEALVRLYPGSEEVKALVESLGMDSSRVSVTTDSRVLWSQLHSKCMAGSFVLGQAKSFEAIVQKAMDEIQERFKR